MLTLADTIGNFIVCSQSEPGDLSAYSTVTDLAKLRG
jgi:hypothetical protein